MTQERDAYEDFDTCLAALAWQYECGVDEAVLDQPLDRFALAAAPPEPVNVARPEARAAAPAEVAPVPKINPLEIAQALVARATTLDELRAALDGFEHCDLKRGARSTVFGHGHPSARVMVITDAPGREEDAAGEPFAGLAATLAAQMFGAIGLRLDSADPARALYAAPAVPWRPEGSREPNAEEIALMRPFLLRHIALVGPEVLVIFGNTPLQALSDERSILRNRGRWFDVAGTPALALYPPALLLRQPLAKREAWADLLALQAKLANMKG